MERIELGRANHPSSDETVIHPSKGPIEHAKITETPPTPLPDPAHPQAVRFNSALQEIELDHSLLVAPPTESDSKSVSNEDQVEMLKLSKTLQDSHLQHRRMSNFAFEPVSLPTSRVSSNEPRGQQNVGEGTRVPGSSPKSSPLVGSIQSPPLTPAVSESQDGQPDIKQESGAGQPEITAGSTFITPQTSGPTASNVLELRGPSSSRPSSSGLVSERTTLFPQSLRAVDPSIRQGPGFSEEPNGSSISPSRDNSVRDSNSVPGSGAVTPLTVYSKPFTPVGERDDPYARSKRPPQSRNLEAIDARFIFGGKDSRRPSSLGGVMGSLPRSYSGGDLKNQDKHQSGFSIHPHSGKKDAHGHDNHSSLSKHHGSMSDLKRFFRIGHSSHKRSQSPAASAKSFIGKSGARTPPHQLPPSSGPFSDDHGLQSKYGKFGKVLGSGAGGSVRLMKRSSDGVTFAVKQFRDRHNYETEREYGKKVTAEFCIGSTLHHGNIIETMDIIHEKGHWYEVMEFAPYDLFAIVMTGKMSREEVACSFLQVLAGVTYLHSMGLAHRDLKLDNVVVNDYGIMKLIDFGSATVFRYPFENDIVLATGIVGSDPYLAPEVYDITKYDPQPVDIWSLAIIFACMSLRRFPWKAPRISDNSYKLFISPPTVGTPPAEDSSRRAFEQRPKSMMDLPSAVDDTRRSAAPNPEISSRQTSGDDASKFATHHYHHRPHHHNHPPGVSVPEQGAASESLQAAPSTGPRAENTTSKPEIIRGPWRLLRLLPRESRAIMGRMLEIDPKKRVTLEEMMEDPWISTTPVCRQVDAGQIIRAAGHEHTLEPGTPDTSTASKK